jgi:HTH-type transcriptional regulator/antitoxin HigA
MTKPVPQFFTLLLENLPEMFVQERLRLGLTQGQLAEKLGMPAQQIQRYEATRYQSASLRRLEEVAAALFALGIE